MQSCALRSIIAFGLAAALLAGCNKDKAPADKDKAAATDPKAATNPGAPAPGAATPMKADATCEEVAAASIPPNAGDANKDGKLTKAVVAACTELPLSAAERGCLASVQTNLGKCEELMGRDRLQTFVETVRNKANPPIPAPSDVAAPPKDAKKTAKGVWYKVQKAGTGKTKPTATSKVKVHYTGWTTDGKMFDSSVARGEPTSFGLDQVIAGWTDGLQTMVEGETTRFWIPVELAYKGQPGAPAGMLVFDVELLKIEG